MADRLQHQYPSLARRLDNLPDASRLDAVLDIANAALVESGINALQAAGWIGQLKADPTSTGLRETLRSLARSLDEAYFDLQNGVHGNLTSESQIMSAFAKARAVDALVAASELSPRDVVYEAIAAIAAARHLDDLDSIAAEVERALPEGGAS